MGQQSRQVQLSENGEIAVVVVAAGRGERAGQSHEGPKQYRRIGGRAVIAHTLEALASHPRIGRIVVAIHAEDADLFSIATVGLSERVTTVIGGASRQESTLAALESLAAEPPRAVLIHDGVRPFVTAGLIGRVCDAIDDANGALPALPVSDTLKRSSSEGAVAGTVSREGLFAAQTPQGFPFGPILDAHRSAATAKRFDFTDDCAIAEWAGLAVKLVAGEADNFKLTWAKDIAMADQRLSDGQFPDVRTGNGYDVHSFVPGDSVTLCGVRIAHGMKLNGHSDSDVALHALTDALLATCGAGDIGTHFPPSDPQWKGAASRIFIEHAARIVRERGGRIANADVTLICEAPKVGPHREAMTAALSDMLRISADRVSIKATTNEKLGFIGRGEGIAAIATATVVYPGSLPQ